MESTKTAAEARFQEAVQEFVHAGERMVELWDDPDQGFYADERFPLPERLRPPMSMDEWLSELAEHYRA